MEQRIETMNTQSETVDPAIRERVLETLHTLGEDIISYEGPHAGPTIFIVGGTHGNEILGVLLLGLLQRNLENGQLPLKAGKIKLALGNPKAIEVNERVAKGGDDLNRMFTPEVLNSEDNQGFEARRARNIAREIRNSDIVIDLHSTNRPSPAFVCAQDTDLHQSVFKWLPRKAVVFDPNRIVSGGGGSIDEIADDYGKVGICYESGQATDTKNLMPVFRALRGLMIENSMVEGELPEPPPIGADYTVVESIAYDPNNAFVFAEGKEQGFAPVTKGELIGHRGDEAVYSSVDGVILFPKRPEHQRMAGLVCYVASRRK
ncbi:hypothetical protein EPO56_01550 [Patescibacteria group bacterium]|nr:MAG: hypothetical protein EPO56_01550 [Patescibacteria group bacterium]